MFLSAPLRQIRPWLLFGCLFALVSIFGCGGSSTPAAAKPSEEKLPSDDELRAMIDEAIDYTAENRKLRTDVNAAWQIFHGVLAYGRDFKIEHEGQEVKAVDWILDGGSVEGWNLRKGDVGLEAILEAGSTRGQGHEDQWLAYLSGCNFPSERPIVVGEQSYTIRDLVNQAMYDVHDGQECSWTLTGLSKYLPLDASWKSRDGSTWTLERIIALEAAQDINESACGGSHRLTAMTLALNRYREEMPDAELTGGWLAAQKKIDAAIETARQFQQPSGAFSVNFFRRPADSPDAATHLGTTGHTLEFLSLALDEDRLREPWVVRSVVELCELFQKTQSVPLECGALYHAAHGLVLYRERRFGQPDDVTEESDVTAAR